MPQTIALVNPKGGSGKTTMAIHLAAVAHRDGHQTTLLDTDPQGSALDWSRRTPDGYDGPRVGHFVVNEQEWALRDWKYPQRA